MIPAHAPSRRGFTLIELLVVMAIISILVGLMMPAVQKVREAGSRTQCLNNLRQINYAMHLYHDAFRALPPSRMDGVATWAVFILPDLEQQNVQRYWDFNKPYYLQNQVARETTLPIFFCPSRRNHSGQLSISGDTPPGSHVNVPGALGDYACSIGTTGMDFMGAAPPNGAFQVSKTNKGISLLNFPDGTSNTFLIGEKHVPIDKFGQGWWDCSLYNGDLYPSATRSAGPGYPLARSPKDTGWLFGSYHPHLCLFAFADGGVRTVSASTPEYILGLWAHRYDGEPQPPVE